MSVNLARLRKDGFQKNYSVLGEKEARWRCVRRWSLLQKVGVGELQTEAAMN